MDRAMPARLRLTFMVVGTLALVAIGLALLLGRKGDDGDALGADTWAGALKPDIPAEDFTLRDQDGKTVSLSDYRGQPVILTFMYSTCQDTCPLLASTIRAALDDLPADVPSLAVSVDPKNDTPETAKQFLLKRSVNGRMEFLLGSRAQLAPVWKAYGVQPQLGQGGGIDPEKDHSAIVVLIDGQGRQRIGFPAEKATPEGVAHDVKRLQAEAQPSS
jgi:protein SCO1